MVRGTISMRKGTGLDTGSIAKAGLEKKRTLKAQWTPEVQTPEVQLDLSFQNDWAFPL